eukprot:7801406-Pyramimonas_sp.AAC.1
MRELPFVQTDVVGLVQRLQGEGVQIEQLGVGGMALGEDEIVEGEGQEGLRAHPGVGHAPHVVLGGEGLEDGNGECQRLRGN